MDVDNQQEAAMKYGIHVVPTFVLVRDGDEVRRTSGVISPDTLKQLWR
jgi:thioredoxin 1